MKIKTNLIRGFWIVLLAAFIIAAAVFFLNGSWPAINFLSGDIGTLPGVLLAKLSFRGNDTGVYPAGQPDAAAVNQAGLPSSDPLTTQAKCEGPDQLVLLALGVDENAQTDLIRLVRMDFVQPKIIILSIPRDFWLPISGLAEYGIGDGRINAAYSYGEHFTGRGTGVEVLAQTIADNFNITIDHFGLIYFSNLTLLIDQIGGVDIRLDKPVDGTLSGLPSFAEGFHQMDGETAMDFMRIRYMDSDDYRIDRQNLVIKEALKKMNGSLSFMELVTFAGHAILEQSVSTSASMDTISAMNCLIKNIGSDNFLYLSVPPEYYAPGTTSQGANVRIPADGAADYIKSVMNGVIPLAPK